MNSKKVNRNLPSKKSSNSSNKEIYYAKYSSPLGFLWVGTYQNQLCFISKTIPETIKTLLYSLKKTAQVPPLLKKELDQYFSGRLKEFRFPTYFLTGTLFEQKVWKALKTIPYGETRSYAWLAKKIGHPQAVRAVGGANGKNCLPIVIPCHRVIKSDGQLGGYSGGIELKKKLLELEGITL